MKFGLDIKNKKAEFNADAEKLIEKGMDIHEKSWKDKFVAKYTAKKEMMEIKHQQKLEREEKKIEVKRKLKEIELLEKRMQEEAERKKARAKIIASVVLGTVGTILIIAGALAGSFSGDQDSVWYSLAIIGFFFYLAIVYMWLFELANNKRKKK